MKNEVIAYFEGYPSISVEGEVLPIENVSLSLILDKLPSGVNFANANNLAWTDPANSGLTVKGSIALANGSLFTFSEDKYNDYVQPYVDLWQAEKDRIEQEQAAAQEEYQKLENTKARAYNTLNEEFEQAKVNAYVVSSLGFTADSDSTAKENVDGLIEVLDDTQTVQFCDYHNIFRTLTKAQLQVLKNEIIQNGQALYAQKWAYRTQLDECGSNEDIAAVLASIAWVYADFTPEPETDPEQEQTE